MHFDSPRVLLIEYEPNLRELEALILREASYRVVVASPTVDPVREAERLSPDVVLVDVRPREPRDWLTIDWLRAHPVLRSVPVVVVSAAERIVAQAHAAPNVRGSLHLPFDVGALQHAVALALSDPPIAALLPPATGPVPREVAQTADALLKEARSIVLRTLERLRRSEPYADHFSELSAALIDDLPAVLGAIVNAMQRDLPPATLTAVPAVAQAIARHVESRDRQGVGGLGAIREYRVLHDEMVAFLRQQIGKDARAAEGSEIDRVIERYVTALVQVVVEQLDGQIAGRGRESPDPIGV